MAIVDNNEMMFRAFEPQVQNRFVMYVDGIESFLIKKAELPKFTDSTKKLDYINTYRKIRGKREWQNTTLTLYSPIAPSAAQQAMNWARLSYESVTGRAGYSDFYKKDIKVAILGPVGDIVSEWIYKGAFISDMSQSELNWSNDGDPIEITLQLTYDYAVMLY